MRQLERLEPRRAKWIKCEKKLQRLYDSYNSGIDEFAYLKKIANIY